MNRRSGLGRVTGGLALLCALSVYSVFAAVRAESETGGLAQWLGALTAGWRGRAAQTAVDPDPSYAVYQRIRYAYDTYGYLFLSLDEPGDGQAGGGDGSAGAAGSVAAGAVGEAGASAGSAFFGAAGSAVFGEAAGAGVGSAESAFADLAANVPPLAQLADYDFLMKHFYSVHTSTTAGRDLMRAEVFLGTDLRVEKDPAVPQILIYHTHSQETYADYGPQNPSANVVGVGSYLTSLLEAKGWNVLHDVSAYDIQGGELDRSKAYNYALDGVSRILEEHPTIQVVLDVHRDGVRESVHLVSDVGGVRTANIMFFQGMSRTPEGEISYLPNPYLKENLAFSFQMQIEAMARYPGFTRKIYLKGLRYNLHLRPRSALIEVGAQTNTGEEAMNAMVPLAEVLDRVLQGR